MILPGAIRFATTLVGSEKLTDYVNLCTIALLSSCRFIHAAAEAPHQTVFPDRRWYNVPTTTFFQQVVMKERETWMKKAGEIQS